MTLSRLVFALFFFLSFSCLKAQPTFKVDRTFFQGEKIVSVSVGSQGVWVVKGNDSLGLGKVNTDIAVDYSSVTSTSLSKPIKFLSGSYRNNALLATEDELYWFKNGVISKIDKQAAGLEGSKILGLENKAERIRVATNTGIYTSYDNLESSKELEIIENRESTKILGGCILYLRDYATCGYAKQIYVAEMVESGVYMGNLRYDTLNEINDFAYGLNHYATPSPEALFIAQKNGLSVNGFVCYAPAKKYLNDTSVYCLRNLGDTIWIGTEKGLFFANSTYSGLPVLHYPLEELADVAIFSMAFETEKGFLWLGTNKGLIRLSYPIKKSNIDMSTAGWLAHLGGKSTENVTATTIDKQGNTSVTGYFSGECLFGDTSLVAYNSEDYFIAQYDKQGKLKWVRTALVKAPQLQLNERGNAITTDIQGNVYSLGNVGIYTPDRVPSAYVSFGSITKEMIGWSSFLTKYDTQGNVLWVSTFGQTDANMASQMKIDAVGNIYILTDLLGQNDFQLPSGKGLLKFAPDGSLLWAKSISGISKIEIGKEGVMASGTFNNSFTLGNFTMISEQQYCAYIISLDENGNVAWGNYISRNGYINNAHIVSIAGLTKDAVGNIYLAGFAYGSLKFDNQTTEIPSDEQGNPLFFAKLTSQGKFIWLKKAGGDNGSILEINFWDGSLFTDSLGFSTNIGSVSGQISIGGQTLPADASSTTTYLLKLDPNGNLVALKKLFSTPTYPYTGIRPIISTDSKGTIIGSLNTNLGAQTSSFVFTSRGQQDAFVFKLTDSTYYPNYNTVRGKIFVDKNQNKVFDKGDETLSGLVLKAEPGSLYSQTDLEGNYIFYLPQGDYSIQQIISNRKGKVVSQLFPINNGTLPVYLKNKYQDTSGFNFIDKAVLSSFISVDINSIRRRRCFRGTTSVQYCNEGFADANQVELKVEFPAYVVPISSNVPWSRKTDREVIYSIVTIAKGECKTITITDSVQCGDESIVGLTQCTKAILSPPNTVVPIDPNWDQSNVDVKGVCKDNGFIFTTVKNTGSGDMEDSTHVKVYLDTTIVYQNNYRLASEDSISLNIPASGKSFRMEATQSAYHPGSEVTLVIVEGCKSPTTNTVSKDIQNKLPIYDKEEEIESSCAPIVSSLDPNDKQVFPSGITENHNILEDQELEYLVRFQNTGTDTAFTVLVSDTLSELLDISTFQAGITSHPGSWNISGKEKPVISCRFDNILLPDSTTNELKSHGFLKFKISPHKNIKGRQIRNKAFIYFDYNSAVITNEVMNTVGMPELVLERVAIQNCLLAPNAQSDSLYLHLCGINQAEVPITKNDSVYSVWKTEKGNGTVLQIDRSSSTINNLLNGTNQFTLVNQYCQLTWYNKIVIERDEIPMAPRDSTIHYCEGQSLDSIYIQGHEIKWYDSPQLLQVIAESNHYLPKYGSNQRFFVTQKVRDCESSAAKVLVEHLPLPAPPVTSSAVYCYKDKLKQISAEGQNITWYYDTLSRQTAGVGNIFVKTDVTQGSSLQVYATQKIKGCESKPTVASLDVKPFDISTVFIPNVISQSQNGEFHLPHQITNECVGDFKQVSVVDLTGKLLFYSENEHFVWHPNAPNSQLLLFQIKFEEKIYKGKMIITE